MGKKKNKGGQPTKYKEEYVLIAEELCREKGYTDKNLAAHFHVSEKTINTWKGRYPQFLQSLKKGKDEFDTVVVEQAMLERALGCIYDEVTKEPKSNEAELVVVKIVTKKILGDVTAQIFWLKNRNPARWSDKQEFSGSIEYKKTLNDDVAAKRMKMVAETGDGLDMKSVEGNSNGNGNDHGNTTKPRE